MGAPLILLIIYFAEPIGLLILILAATGRGLIEFYRLTLPDIRTQERIVAMALGLSLPLVAHFGEGDNLLIFIVLAILVLFILFAIQPGSFEGITSRMALLLLGIVWISFLLSHILLLGKEPMGTRWVFFLLLTVWAGDTCAYFTGTLVGKHKLYPRISPGKSVEGLFGGLVGSILVAFAFETFFLRALGWGSTLVLPCVLTILGQIGDFGESLIKRSVHVKDSSRLIPGHGGMLDRLDSFLFSAPFLCYYVHWLYH